MQHSRLENVKMRCKMKVTGKLVKFSLTHPGGLQTPRFSTNPIWQMGFCPISKGDLPHQQSLIKLIPNNFFGHSATLSTLRRYTNNNRLQSIKSQYITNVLATLEWGKHRVQNQRIAFSHAGARLLGFIQPGLFNLDYTL